MAEIERPQTYLITPPDIELSHFPTELAKVLDAHAVACVRIALASQDETHLGHACDLLRDICHARDVAIVVDTHLGLVERHGLDGVHLGDGSRSVRNARKQLGADAIVGAYCGASRHDGITAGEIGCDYVSFGPVSATGLGDGTVAPHDLFAWWSEMVEVPVVAEGKIDREGAAKLAQVTDFFAIGDEIWRLESPAEALSDLIG